MSGTTTEERPIRPRGESSLDFGVEVRYERTASRLTRTVRSAVGESTFFIERSDPIEHVTPGAEWHIARGRGAAPQTSTRSRKTIKTVDLFSGAGGLALGTAWAVEAVGRRPRPLLAVDVDAAAIDVHQYNHVPRRVYQGSVRDLLTPASIVQSNDPMKLIPSATIAPGAEWLQSLGPVDVLTGGPPCQGHSNLNNRTRREDDRNQLYYWMALGGHAMQAKAIVVENVASVLSDAGDVVGATLRLLGQLGYAVVFEGLLNADRLGVAQSRKRHFLIAVRRDVMGQGAESVEAWLRSVDLGTVSVMDAIGDLQDLESNDEYDRPSGLSEENRRRIDYLFDEGAFDLPDHVRPASHRDGHTYPSVYGRMFPDRPAGTLSTGFLSPGRGRYVHPTRRRTLTLHEGARVQGFPDDFQFRGASGSVPKRTEIARMIGDAVPPPLAFHVVLAALAALDGGALDEG